LQEEDHSKDHPEDRDQEGNNCDPFYCVSFLPVFLVRTVDIVRNDEGAVYEETTVASDEKPEVIVHVEAVVVEMAALGGILVREIETVDPCKDSVVLDALSHLLVKVFLVFIVIQLSLGFFCDLLIVQPLSKMGGLGNIIILLGSLDQLSKDIKTIDLLCLIFLS
jgi:hypothetical protein